MNVTIGQYKSPRDLKTEVVERKGIGHPDTVADQLAEFIYGKSKRQFLT